MDPRKTNARRGYSDRQKKKREKSRAEAAAGWQPFENTLKKEKTIMNTTVRVILFVLCGLIVIAAILCPALGIFHLSGWMIPLYVIGAILLIISILLIVLLWPPRWWVWTLLGVGMIIIVLSILGSNLWGWGMTEPDVDVKNETIIEPTIITETKATPEPPQTHGNSNPQSYVPHPNFYVETTVSSKEYTWVITVNEGEIGIVGGWSVNGRDQGTYQAFEPGTYTVSVIDGFALTVEKQWAQAEWLFRIEQAKQYNWAHTNLDPGPIILP